MKGGIMQAGFFLRFSVFAQAMLKRLVQRLDEYYIKRAHPVLVSTPEWLQQTL